MQIVAVADFPLQGVCVGVGGWERGATLYDTFLRTNSLMERRLFQKENDCS